MEATFVEKELKGKILTCYLEQGAGTMTKPEKRVSLPSQATQEIQVGLPARPGGGPPGKLRPEGQRRVRSS